MNYFLIHLLFGFKIIYVIFLFSFLQHLTDILYISTRLSVIMIILLLWCTRCSLF